MATNPYFMYRKHEEKRSTTLAATVAHFFERAANHIQEAGVCIEKGNYEELITQAQRAQDVLFGLAENLTPTDEETEKVAQVLYDYYTTMAVLTSRMAIKQDLQTCHAIEKSLRQMQQCWLTTEHHTVDPNVTTPPANNNSPV